MSDASLTSNQKSIVQRLRHLEKFEWIKNHDTYNAGLTTREGREILAEIERQWGVNVANHMHAKTITEDLFKARAEIERLRAALEAADSLYEDALRVASDVGLHEQDDLWAALETYEDKRDPLKRAADETTPRLRFPSNETLRRQIESDPDDDPSAGGGPE